MISMLKEDATTDRCKLLYELASTTEAVIVRRNISEKPSDVIIAAVKGRRRQQSSRKGIQVKVITVEEIQTAKAEQEAKEAENKAGKEEAAKRAAENKLQRQIYLEELPIHKDLINALKH